MHTVVTLAVLWELTVRRCQTVSRINGIDEVLSWESEFISPVHGRTSTGVAGGPVVFYERTNGTNMGPGIFKCASTAPAGRCNWVRAFVDGILRLGGFHCALCAFSNVSHPTMCTWVIDNAEVHIVQQASRTPCPSGWGQDPCVFICCWSKFDFNTYCSCACSVPVDSCYKAFVVPLQLFSICTVWNCIVRFFLRRQ